jgi:outer membrane protein OmpA-like peptidoglycan-associated protein
MAINLLDIFKETVGDQLVNQASGYLGESKENTRSALGAILPAILGGLVNKGNSQVGASAILDFLKNQNEDGALLDNLVGLFDGGGATDELVNKGSGVLDFIFGNKSAAIDTILDLVSNSSGIGKSSASSLINMVAPLLMGVVGKSIKDNGLDTIGLEKLLSDQKTYLQAEAPAGLFDKLGIAGLGTVISDRVEEVVAEVTATGSTIMSRLGPWLVLFSLALGLLYFMRSCGGREPVVEMSDKPGEMMDTAGDKMKEAPDLTQEKVKEAEPKVAEVAEKVTEVASESMRKVVDGIASIKLPSGKEINAESGSFIDNVYTYVSGGEGSENTRFTFDNLTFQTGSANIAPASQPQLQNAAEILNAYPEAHIRIEGHTDNAGDAAANKALSEQRALAVKRALNSMGVSNDRMATMGYGQDSPVAGNDTEAGKRENRRVDIFVTKR